MRLKDLRVHATWEPPYTGLKIHSLNVFLVLVPALLSGLGRTNFGLKFPPRKSFHPSVRSSPLCQMAKYPTVTSRLQKTSIRYGAVQEIIYMRSILDMDMI